MPERGHQPTIGRDGYLLDEPIMEIELVDMAQGLMWVEPLKSARSTGIRSAASTYTGCGPPMPQGASPT